MSDDYKVKPLVFDGGGPAQSVDYNYDAIDAYCFGADESGEGVGAVLGAFTTAFDSIANVPPNDFKAMANRLDAMFVLFEAAYIALMWAKGENAEKFAEWLAEERKNVKESPKSNDHYKSEAIRIQSVRSILTGKDQVQMAREIGVTKAAISQRMCDLRDTFEMRNPKANLRNNSTRKKFSTECKQRHKEKKQALSGSPNSPTTSTTNSSSPTPLPSMPSKQAEPLSKRLFALANS